MPRRLSWIFRPDRARTDRFVRPDFSRSKEDIAEALAEAGRLSAEPINRLEYITERLQTIFQKSSSDFLAVTCCFVNNWQIGSICGSGKAAPGPLPRDSIGSEVFLSSTAQPHRPLDDVANDLPQAWLDWLRAAGARYLVHFPEPIHRHGAWFSASQMHHSPEWISLLNFTARMIVATARVFGNVAVESDPGQDDILEREFGQWLQTREPQLLAEMLGEQLAEQFGLDRSLFLFEDCGERRSVTIHARGIEPRRVEAIAAGMNPEPHPPEQTAPRLGLLQGTEADTAAQKRKATDPGFQYSLSVPAEDGARVVGIIGAKQPRWLSAPERQRLEHWLRRFQLALDNQRRISHLEALSYTDATTGIFNCRFFKRRLGEEITRARRFDRSLSLVMFDLDDFKLLNDTFGHLAGDQILREIAELLLVTIRSIDVACRYGGDEFVVIMPETEGKDCICFTRRLQRTILNHTFRPRREGETRQLTISMGAAVFPTHADGPERLFWCADMAMLNAKEAGRNKVVMYEPGMSNSHRPVDR